MASATYLVVVEVSSPGQLELEVALVELAKKHRIAWQWGPREVTVSAKVAKVAISDAAD